MKVIVRMITSHETAIEVDEIDDPEQIQRVAYERAVERRDEKPGSKSWRYHAQSFKIVGW